MAEIDMADSVTPNNVNVILDNVAWAICFRYHTVLKASPGVAIFRQDMLFDIPFVTNWNKIGDHRQSLTDHILYRPGDKHQALNLSKFVQKLKIGGIKLHHDVIVFRNPQCNHYVQSKICIFLILGSTHETHCIQRDKQKTTHMSFGRKPPLNDLAVTS